MRPRSCELIVHLVFSRTLQFGDRFWAFIKKDMQVCLMDVVVLPDLILPLSTRLFRNVEISLWFCLANTISPKVMFVTWS